VSATMVYLRLVKGLVNGNTPKNAGIMKLPIDAFWRRYEEM